MWDTINDVGSIFIVFYFIYMIIRVFVWRKERIIMVEKMNVHPDGATPQKFQREGSPYSYLWVKVAALLVGIGFGFLTNYIVWSCMYYPGSENVFEEGPFGLLMFASLLLFAGLGMFGGIMLERRMRREGEKKGKI